jgi:PKHD-type hydroxylase
MVRNDAQRGMLYELDRHIQALRLQQGDSPEVLGLTGHYHNLLRMWSEV